MARKQAGFVPFAPWYGVFETVQVRQGVPLFFVEHGERMSRGARALGLTVPRMRPEFGRDGRWRWILTRSGLNANDFTVEPPWRGRPQFALHIASQRVGSANWDARFKTLSYLTHSQARGEAETYGADEAVLLNEHGHLASGAMTNLFWVRAGRLCTPAHEAGCREGVIRGFVLSHFREADVREDWPASQLTQADEIFVTNSMMGVQPVTRMGPRNVPIGPVCTHLRKLYQAEVRRQIADGVTV